MARMLNNLGYISWIGEFTNLVVERLLLHQV